MTQTAGSTETYDSAALKESLDSVIWDLSVGALTREG